MDMKKMMQKAKKMQAKMKEVQDQLDDLHVDAEAGGGMVKVTANGNRKIVSINLDNDVIDPDDKEMLEDLVVAGVNKALEKAEEAGKQKMQDVYKDMMPGGGIPGMDMSKLGL